MVELIRTLIDDNIVTYEDTFSANNQSVIRFAHYPVISATVEVDNTVVIGTLNNNSGVFIADTPMTGTVYVKYQSAWFTDETIDSMSVYVSKTINLLQVDTDKWVMPIPYYPIKFAEASGNAITYDATTNQFTCSASEVKIVGTFLDIYATAGTLLLMKASMPQRIKREFASMNDWGSYPDIAKGLQDQAMAWFKISGVSI